MIGKRRGGVIEIDEDHAAPGFAANRDEATLAS
jgi:hypothetical protein